MAGLDPAIHVLLAATETWMPGHQGRLRPSPTGYGRACGRRKGTGGISTMSLAFGVFDHLDASGAPLRDFYEDRLKLAELYDRLGLYCYQVAEHHSTPLGMAPSPSVFLSALAQRTKRINFGPLVYTLPLYHPIRLIEEICMLDQMSGGRFQFGVGKGISPIEVRYYGLDPEKLGSMFIE